MSNFQYSFQNPSLPVEDRIKDLLSLLTLQEKISLLYDLSPGIPRLGIKKYYHGNECLHGVVRPGRATVFPQAIAFAATWDPDLIYRVATAISDEARAKHHAIDEYPGTYNGLLTFWSPNVNVAIDPRWGRTPETYGEDPYLTGRIGVQFVKGLQGNDPTYLKVVSTPKHYVANNEEHNRFKLKPKISEKWLRDYFLPGFQPLIMEGKAESIMGAYNAVFDVPCCHSKWLLIDVLRKEWGFNGYAVTDCGAVAHALPYAHRYVLTPTQAAASAMNAGIDLECGPIFKRWLEKAVKKGLVSEARIDEAAHNVLRARMKLGMFDPLELNPYAKIPFEVVGSKKHSDLALLTAEESIVLLKNSPLGSEPLLPIDKTAVKSIAIIGPNANVAQFGDYSGLPFNHPVTPLMGVISKLKDCGIKINYVPWIPYASTQGFMVIPAKNLRPKVNCEKMYGLFREYYPEQNFKGPVSKFIDETVDMNYRSETADPTISNAQTDAKSSESISKNFSVKWKGLLCPDITGEYEIKVQSRTTSRFKKAKVKVGDSELASNIKISLEQGKQYPIEVQLSHGGLNSRIELKWKLPQYHPSVSNLNFEREKEAAKASDLVLCYSGLSWGDEHEGIDRHDFNISQEQQQLIQTISAVNQNFILILIAGSNLAVNWENDHIPAILHAWYPGERGGDAIANVIFGDYNPAGRLPLTFYKDVNQLPAFNDYEMSNGKTYWFLKGKPLYAFGHGLSYTTFEYSNLSIKEEKIAEDGVFHTQVHVKNTGKRAGDEVVQLYIQYEERDINTPIMQLKAFKRVYLQAGEAKDVALEVAGKSLKFWDANSKQYKIRTGSIKILIGSSSDVIRLSGKARIT